MENGKQNDPLENAQAAASDNVSKASGEGFGYLSGIDPDTKSSLESFVQLNEKRANDILAGRPVPDIETPEMKMRARFRDQASVEATRDRYILDGKEGHKRYINELLFAIQNGYYVPTSESGMAEAVWGAEWKLSGWDEGIARLNFSLAPSSEEQGVPAKFNYLLQVLKRAKDRNVALENAIQSDALFAAQNALTAPIEEGGSEELLDNLLNLSANFQTLQPVIIQTPYQPDRWEWRSTYKEAFIDPNLYPEDFYETSFGAGLDSGGRTNRFSAQTGVDNLRIFSRERIEQLHPGVFEQAEKRTSKDFVALVDNYDPNSRDLDGRTKKNNRVNTDYYVLPGGVDGISPDGNVQNLYLIPFPNDRWMAVTDEDFVNYRRYRNYREALASPQNENYRRYLQMTLKQGLSERGLDWLAKNTQNDSVRERHDDGKWAGQITNLVSWGAVQEMQKLPEADQALIMQVLTLGRPSVNGDGWAKTVGWHLFRGTEDLFAGVVRGGGRFKRTVWNAMTATDEDVRKTHETEYIQDQLNAMGDLDIRYDANNPWMRYSAIAAESTPATAAFLVGGEIGALGKAGVMLARGAGLGVRGQRAVSFALSHAPLAVTQTLGGWNQAVSDFAMRCSTDEQFLEGWRTASAFGLATGFLLNYLSEYMPVSVGRRFVARAAEIAQDTAAHGTRAMARRAAAQYVAGNFGSVAASEALQEVLQGGVQTLVQGVVNYFVDYAANNETLDGTFSKVDVPWDDILFETGASILPSLASSLALVGLTAGGASVVSGVSIDNRVQMAVRRRDEQRAAEQAVAMLRGRREAQGVHLPAYQKTMDNFVRSELARERGRVGRDLTEEETAATIRRAQDMIAVRDMEQVYNTWATTQDEQRKKAYLAGLGFSETDIAKLEDLFHELYEARNGAQYGLEVAFNADSYNAALRAAGLDGVVRASDVADAGPDGERAVRLEIAGQDGRGTTVVMRQRITGDEAMELRGSFASVEVRNEESGEGVDATQVVDDLIEIREQSMAGTTFVLGHELAHNLLDVMRRTGTLTPEREAALRERFATKDGAFDEEAFADAFGDRLSRAFVVGQRELTETPDNAVVRLLDALAGWVARIVEAVRRTRGGAVRTPTDAAGAVDALVRETPVGQEVEDGMRRSGVPVDEMKEVGGEQASAAAEDEGAQPEEAKAETSAPAEEEKSEPVPLRADRRRELLAKIVKRRGRKFSIENLYTGGPVLYRTPDTSFIGSNETGAAYGWGLYASNKWHIAKYYADLSLGGNYRASNKPSAQVNVHYQGQVITLSELEKILSKKMYEKEERLTDEERVISNLASAIDEEFAFNAFLKEDVKDELYQVVSKIKGFDEDRIAHLEKVRSMSIVKKKAFLYEGTDSWEPVDGDFVKIFGIPDGAKVKEVEFYFDKDAKLVYSEVGRIDREYEEQIKKKKENRFTDDFEEKLWKKYFENAIPPTNARPAIHQQVWFTNRAPGDESHLLLWEKPLSKENRARVVEAVESLGLPDGVLTNKVGEDWRTKEMTGEEAYRFVMDAVRKSGLKEGERADKVASQLLYAYDIDGNIHHVGDAVRQNYVAFSDEHLEVVSAEQWNPETKRYERVFSTEELDGVRYDPEGWGDIGASVEVVGEGKPFYVVGDDNKKARAQAIELGLDNARKQANAVVENGNVYLMIDGVRHQIAKSGLKHGLDRRLKNNVDSVVRIGDVMNASVPVPASGGNRSYRIAVIDNGTTSYILIVERNGEVEDLRILHSLNTKREEGRFAGPSFTSQTYESPSDKISVANLKDAWEGVFLPGLRQHITGRSWSEETFGAPRFSETEAGRRVVARLVDNLIRHQEDLAFGNAAVEGALEQGGNAAVGKWNRVASAGANGAESLPDTAEGLAKEEKFRAFQFGRPGGEELRELVREAGSAENWLDVVGTAYEALSAVRAGNLLGGGLAEQIAKRYERSEREAVGWYVRRIVEARATDYGQKCYLMGREFAIQLMREANESALAELRSEYEDKLSAVRAERRDADEARRTAERGRDRARERLRRERARQRFIDADRDLLTRWLLAEAQNEVRATRERERAKAAEAVGEAKAQTREAKKAATAERNRADAAERALARERETSANVAWQLAEERLLSRYYEAKMKHLMEMRVRTLRDRMRETREQQALKDARKRALERERGMSFAELQGVLGFDLMARVEQAALSEEDVGVLAERIVREIDAGFDKETQQGRKELWEWGTYTGEAVPLRLTKQGERAYAMTAQHILKGLARKLAYGRFRESMLTAADGLGRMGRDTAGSVLEGKIMRSIQLLRAGVHGGVAKAATKRMRAAVADANRALQGEASSARNRFLKMAREIVKDLSRVLADVATAQTVGVRGEKKREKLAKKMEELERELAALSSDDPKVRDTVALAKDETLTERQHKDAMLLMFLDKFGNIGELMNPLEMMAKAEEAERFVRDILMEHVSVFSARKEAAARMSEALANAMPEATGDVPRGYGLLGAFVPSMFDQLRWPLGNDAAARAVIDQFERMFAQAALNEAKMNREDNRRMNEMIVRAYRVEALTEQDIANEGFKLWRGLVDDVNPAWSAELSLDNKTLSRANLIYIFASLRQKDVYDKMAKHYTRFDLTDKEGKVQKKGIDVYLEKLRGVLTAGDIALADEVVRFFADKRAPISATSTNLFGLSVYSPDENYVPLEVENAPTFGTVGAPRQFVIFPNFLKSRVWHNKPLKETVSINSLVRERSGQVNRWVAYAELFQLGEMVFKDEDVAKRYRQAIGATNWKNLSKQWMDVFTGLEHTGNKYWNTARSIAATIGMSWNFFSAARQSEGIFAWATDIGVKDMTGALWDTLSGIATKEGRARFMAEWNSEIVRNRMETGSLLEQRQVLAMFEQMMANGKRMGKGRRAVLGAFRTYSNAGFVPLKLVDGFSCALIMTGLRPRLEEKWRRLGETDARARELANQELEVMVQRLQQSGRPEYLNTFQRSGNGWEALTMFAGPAMMTSGIYLSALHDLSTAIKTGDKNLRRLALTRVCGIHLRGLFYSVLTSMLTPQMVGLYLGGEPEKHWDEILEDGLVWIALNTLFAGFTGLVVVGALVQTAISLTQDWLAADGKRKPNVRYAFGNSFIRFPGMDTLFRAGADILEDTVELSESDYDTEAIVRFALGVGGSLNAGVRQTRQVLESAGVVEPED